MNYFLWGIGKGLTKAVKSTLNEEIGEIKTTSNKSKIKAGGTEITDSWTKIFESIDNGTYKRKYHIGDYAHCSFASEGSVYMQIAAFDTDEKADGTGKAAITWISAHVLNTKRKMNPELPGWFAALPTNKGGWEFSDLRHYVKTELTENLSVELRNRLVAVKKYDGTACTTDEIWIPSYAEVYEHTYGDFFNYENYIIKYTRDFSSTSSWWLRTPFETKKFCMVSKHGGCLKILANVEDGVLPCFCT